MDAEPDRTSVADYLLTVEETEHGPQLVQEPARPRPASGAEPVGSVPAAREAAAVAEDAAWVEEVLADRASHDDAHLGSGEWEAVEEESLAWVDTDGSEVTEAWTQH